MDKNTRIVWKAIDELIPYEHNAKEHTEIQIDNIAKSLEKNGWQNVVLIDKDNVIIYGHGRVLGAQQIGMAEAPCIVCDDLTEEEIKNYRHLDNLLSEGRYLQDEFDIDMPDLDDYDFSEIDLGFDVDEYFDEGYGTDFTLPDGDKPPFKQMTFTFATEQADEVERVLKGAKSDGIANQYDNYGNENGNGNALYGVIRQWEEQRI